MNVFQIADSGVSVGMIRKSQLQNPFLDAQPGIGRETTVFAQDGARFRPEDLLGEVEVHKPVRLQLGQPRPALPAVKIFCESQGMVVGDVEGGEGVVESTHLVDPAVVAVGLPLPAVPEEYVLEKVSQPGLAFLDFVTRTRQDQRVVGKHVPEFRGLNHDDVQPVRQGLLLNGIGKDPALAEDIHAGEQENQEYSGVARKS
jgi:hypothetical protein